MIGRMDYIKVRGARQHNLKNIDIDIPKNKLVVFTGVSGSGKSSLAFDTIYAEGQRRYVESLSTYARQFLGIMGKPDVDLIEGLSPAISIDQKTTSHNPRSTVGTVTEIYDYLRLLWARAGHPHCPICGREISSQTTEQIAGAVMDLIMGGAGKQARFMIFAPIIKDRKGEFSALFANLKSKGYRRVRLDGEIHDLDEDFVLIKTNKHSIDVVIDRISASTNDLKDELFVKSLSTRVNDGIEQALKLSDGSAVVSKIFDSGFEMPEYPKVFEDHLFSEKFACPVDNISLPELEPRTFSFNSPHGACPTCAGLGRILKVDPARVLAPELSVLEGGVIPYASTFEHDTWLSRLILAALQENGIDPDMAIKKYTPDQKKILLEGTSGKTYRVEGTNRFGRMTYITEAWPGVLTELERRYHTSDSDYIKSGIEKYMTEVVCEDCHGARLKKEALSITINGQNISEVTDIAVKDTLVWAKELKDGKILSNRESEIAGLVLKEIIARLNFLINVGLDYLTVSRAANTLSGGEAARIRLASQIGSGLTGVLYVLDEPTIGLHPRDNELLIATLKKLRDLGNTVVVVEHDRDVISSADYVFDFGPGAGKHGGGVVAQGTLEEIKGGESLTGKYLSGRRVIRFPKVSQNGGGNLGLFGASQFNLKNIDVHFPLGKFIAVTGVSGSGKSTLVVETLYHALAKSLNKYHREQAGEFTRIEGDELIDKVVLIDQAPIGRTPRSNPATYTKVFDLIRDVFALTREAKTLGFKKGRFSFNVKGGRCEVCEGQGKIKIEMQFMPDIWVDCEVCHGARYGSQTLEVTYKGKSIAEVLAMTVEEALEFFHVYKNIVAKLETLKAVGLDYMELGQAATTLSGGEAQRVKLATELSKKATGKTVYILDEPTTGLHFADLEKLVAVLKILVERGNTVIVIEHNLDVIKNADWLIELGPEGGELGGRVVAEGEPNEIKNAKTHTGKFLEHTL
ncbi:excinuclease ABC subunit A [Candidatus Woesebacteria bacterium RIFCSPHIGHO2_01_FULL_44_21]|uniref:UvrABC system protein A n=1 Tax=Candidatus Woesebacteria bacterium RIFCSPHIGHO2_01_FULL_44_21 TaxID=1802503 RepID=A0A1F7YZN8_9BACT|nr:MAG: excinuclease ABC subunit A [Candidatus Woesebacteria bacterium RIFCSPHIGHO2_01_FULL_44_21]OGM71123.1 MAG: excinuclease ABC subunit A [Candidatus Woesebacteria bacterium RIFCSPLOWO2_01_FULL_44_24b]